MKAAWLWYKQKTPRHEHLAPLAHYTLARHQTCIRLGPTEPLLICEAEGASVLGHPPQVGGKPHTAIRVLGEVRVAQHLSPNVLPHVAKCWK